MTIQMKYPPNRGHGSGASNADFNDNCENETYRIYLPKQIYTHYRGFSAHVDEIEKVKFSKAIFELLDKVDETFGGEKIECYGSLTSPYKTSNYKTEFTHEALGFAILKIQDGINANTDGPPANQQFINGNLTSEQMFRLRQLQKGTIFGKLFTVDSSRGIVEGFTGKASPIRAALKLYHPELVDKFDNGLTESDTSDTTTNISLTEMVIALEDTRKFIISSLENGGVEATPSAIYSYLEYFHMKKLKVVKDSILTMPFLKKDNWDQTIINLVGKGISYEKLMAIYVTDNFPDEEEVLNAFGEMPFSWMMKILV